MILRLLGIELYKALSRIGNLILLFVLVIAAFFSVPVIKANEYSFLSDGQVTDTSRSTAGSKTISAEEMYQKYSDLAESSKEPQKSYYSACAEAYRTLLYNDVSIISISTFSTLCSSTF